MLTKHVIKTKHNVLKNRMILIYNQCALMSYPIFPYHHPVKGYNWRLPIDQSWIKYIWHADVSHRNIKLTIMNKLLIICILWFEPSCQHMSYCPSNGCIKGDKRVLSRSLLSLSNSESAPFIHSFFRTKLIWKKGSLTTSVW